MRRWSPMQRHSMPGRTSRLWLATSSSAGSRTPSRRRPGRAASDGPRRSSRTASVGRAAGQAANTESARASSSRRWSLAEHAAEGTVSFVGWGRQGRPGPNLAVARAYPRARPGSLAQWQRIGLLIRWFWVRVPGDPRQTPCSRAQVPRLASKERSRQPGPVWKFAVRGGNPCSASIIAIGAVVRSFRDMSSTAGSGPGRRGR